MSVKEQSTDDVKMWWEQKSGLQRTLESVSDALTTAEIDPQQYEIYFFQDNKAKKKKVNGEVIYRYTKTVSFSTHS